LNDQKYEEVVLILLSIERLIMFNDTTQKITSSLIEKYHGSLVLLWFQKRKGVMRVVMNYNVMDEYILLRPCSYI